MVDSDERRKQVAQLYASMREEELNELADEAWTLTESGKELLRAELARRGLEFELAGAASLDVRSGNPVAIRRFRHSPEALLAKGFLESAGIESFLMDEITVRMDWLWSNALGGIKFCVRAEDDEDAIQLLNQEIPERFIVDGVGDYEQPRCPQCQSLNISNEDLNKPVTYASILVLGFLIPVRRRRWKCNFCGHVWQPSSNESNQTR
jgi:hypothetical protein